MGVYYAHLHKTQESYEEMQQADALDTNDISTLMNLTRMVIELKEKDKARANQERLGKLPNGGPAADSFTSAMQKLQPLLGGGCKKSFPIGERLFGFIATASQNIRLPCSP